MAVTFNQNWHSEIGRKNLEWCLEPQDPSLIWTLLGIPVMTLPVLNGTGGLPVGLTILGPKYSDYSLHDFSFKHIMPFKSEIVVPNVVMDS